MLCSGFITKLRLILKLWSWNIRLKCMVADYGRERISETVWNLLHICLSFVFRSPLWVLLFLECLLNLFNTGFNICVSNLCLFFCGNFSYVQFWLVKGQGRLDRLCIIVDFTSYGKPMWTQKTFKAVFKSLGSAWWDKLYIKYFMLRKTNLLTKKLVGETMSYFLWEREKRYTMPLFHHVVSWNALFFL